MRGASKSCDYTGTGDVAGDRRQALEPAPRVFEAAVCQGGDAVLALAYSRTSTVPGTNSSAAVSRPHARRKADLGIIPAETLIEKIERELDIPVLFVDTCCSGHGR